MSLRRERGAAFAVGALLAAHAVLAWLGRGPGIEASGDDAKYVLLARSLRHFSYRELWIAGDPVHAQYPPGYPFVLSALTLFGVHFDLLVVFNIACSVAALACLAYAVRRVSSPGLALCAVGALAFNYSLIAWAGRVLSEPLFMLLVTAGIALLAGEPRPSNRRLALAGALAIAGAMTRTAGIALIAPVFFLYLLQRRWIPAAAFAVVASLVVGGWLAWTAHFASQASLSYMAGVQHTARVATTGTSGLTEYINGVIQRAVWYATAAIPVAFETPTIEGTTLDNLVVGFIGAVAVVAGLVRCWKTWPALTLALPMGLTLLVMWPITDGRFVTPLLPFFSASLVLGLSAIAGLRQARWGLAAATLVALVLGVQGIRRTSALLASRAPCVRGTSPPARSCVSPERAAFFDALVYLRDSVTDRGTVLNAKAPPVFYYSHHKGGLTWDYVGGDTTTMPQRLAGSGAQWLLLSSLNPSEVRSGLRLHNACARVALVPERHFTPRTWLFRVAPQAADSTTCRALDNYRLENLGRDFNADP